jgi:nicotinate phosphoribosyltransferase
MAIIKSLLDTDLYKLTMMQAVFHQQPTAGVKYEFKCRNKGIDFRPYLEFIKSEIEAFRKLTFQFDELSYLKSLGLFKEDFLNYLFIYRNDANRIDIYIDKNGDLQVDVHGTWLNTILAEVPILAIVNEIYFTNGKTKEQLDAETGVAVQRLMTKIGNLQRASVLNSELVKIMEFGTRRRRYFEHQDRVIGLLKEHVPANLIGTSNVYFARKYNIPCKGTHAHEWFMAHQALVRLQDFQKVALQRWQDEYPGSLGIALADTLGFDAFLRDFNLYFAKLYDGIRQDSGDPIDVYNRMVAHYEKLGIDPKTKTIIFSDGLTIDSAIELKKQTPKMNALFGIGTSLTNDFGDEALQIVMKMTECNGSPVAKISEARGKTMCNDDVFLAYLKKVFQIHD